MAPGVSRRTADSRVRVLDMDTDAEANADADTGVGVALQRMTLYPGLRTDHYYLGI